MADLTAPGVVAKVEGFVWNLTKPPQSLASATAAYAGKHAKQFTRWLWRKKGLLPSDPIAGVSLPSLKPESPRRDLTAQELARLNEATENATGKFRGLTGPDRAILYLTTVATGYRAWEMGLLTPDHFDLDAEVPVARIKGEDTKNDDLAIQPIPPVLVARLREYLKDRPRQKPIWPGSWHRRAADMLRRDLDRAGIPHLTEAGEVVFHSLRHSYSSLLSQVATVKVTQELVRHSSPNLTIGRYTHTGMAEKAEAVGKLPLPGTAPTGPFASMGRPQLEALAENLLAYSLCLEWALRTPAVHQQPTLRTPLRTPTAGNSGDTETLVGTDPVPEDGERSTKKTL